jgi:hypothetical protein
MSNCVNDTLSKSDIYSELKSDLRHFGNLRFAMLTVYMTATASLLLAYYYVPSSNKITIPKHFIVYGGLWVTFAFGFLEAFLNHYLHSLNKSVKLILGSEYPYLHTHRKWYVLWPIRLMFISLYIFMFVFWLKQTCF